jgi:hypothetical protein
VVGKFWAENLKKKLKTLEESGKRIRIKTVDIIFRSLPIIFLSFHPDHRRFNISELSQFICKNIEIFMQGFQGESKKTVDK